MPNQLAPIDRERLAQLLAFTFGAPSQNVGKAPIEHYADIIDALAAAWPQQPSADVARVEAERDALAADAEAWRGLVELARTHGGGAGIDSTPLGRWYASFGYDDGYIEAHSLDELRDKLSALRAALQVARGDGAK